MFYIYFKKMYKNNFLFLVIIFLSSCKTLYVSKPFLENDVPNKPHYENIKSWAVLPENYPSDLIEISGPYIKKDVDIFYIYPTLLTDPKSSEWNANIFDDKTRKNVISVAVKNQASSWAESGNLYVPFYRQAHYRSFVDDKNNLDNIKSWKIAYQDINNAFEYYLKNYNNGKPIIIAAHSQGSLLAKELLKKYFDGKILQKKLIAAYIPGIKILSNDFSDLKLMTSPDEIGGFLTWNTYKINKFPKTYDKWFKGGLTINPITWNNKTQTEYSEHLGLLYSDNKIYPNSLKIKLIDGLIWSTTPKVPKRILLFFIKNYHFADVNLFWEDIKQNSIIRVKKWKEFNLNSSIF